MLGILTVLHVIVCVSLIIVVLLQSGRGTGLASVFGGGGGGAIVGGKGFGGILAKATAFLAVAFMLTSIALTVVPRGGGEGSILLEEQSGAPAAEAPEQQPQPRDAQPSPGEPSQAPGESQSGE